MAMTCTNILEIQEAMMQVADCAKNLIGGRSPYNYRKWFIENSDHFKIVNKEASKDMAIKYHSKIQSCYYNCGMIAMFHSQYKYYEGYVWSNRIPIPLEHSWLVDSNQTVIDPTLILDAKFRRQKITNRTGDEYMGVHLPTNDLRKFILKNKISGPFILDYWHCKFQKID